MISFFDILKEIRHSSKLRKFNFFWVNLGNFYRVLFLKFGSPFNVNTLINEYGPYKVDGYFAFSDFKNWGKTNNFGFKKFIKYCLNKSCVIDVGAHVGLMALPASFKLKKGGRIFCFEPSDTNRKYLVKHIKINYIKNIFIFRDVVSDKNNSNVYFFEKKVPSGLNSVSEIRNKGFFAKKLKKTVTLDMFVKEKKICPEIIKIDVEGYEFNVLKGSKNVIQKYKPVIFLSIHPNHLKKLKIKETQLFNFINKLNYNIIQINKNDTNELLLSPK